MGRRCPVHSPENSGPVTAMWWKAWDDGALVAAIDGLGHGPHAADVALIAADVLQSLAEHDAELPSLVRRCHEALLGTRGVVMSLARFSAADESLTWMGIGNVDASLLRADSRTKPDAQTLLLRGGVVGYQLPSLRAAKLPIQRGDLLILSTDGVSSGFEKTVHRVVSPQQLADEILMNHNKGNDDALVLVTRYLGGGKA